MRESVCSLRAYLVLTGIFGCLWTVLIVMVPAPVPAKLVAVVFGVYNGLSMLLGLVLPVLLVRRASLVLTLMRLSVVVSMVTFNILGVLVNVYIYRQLLRLSAESRREHEDRRARGFANIPAAAAESEPLN